MEGLTVEAYHSLQSEQSERVAFPHDDAYLLEKDTICIRSISEAYGLDNVCDVPEMG